MGEPDLTDLERFTRLISTRLHEPLTPGEALVAYSAIALCLSPPEMARQYGLLPNTAAVQLSRVRRKLGAPTTYGLLRVIADYWHEVGVEDGLDLARTRIRAVTHAGETVAPVATRSAGREAAG